MSFFAWILFAIMAYRHSAGQARYYRWLLWTAYILSLGTVLPFAYLGYRRNPNHNELKFKEVL